MNKFLGIIFTIPLFSLAIYSIYCALLPSQIERTLITISITTTMGFMFFKGLSIIKKQSLSETVHELLF